MGNDSSERKLPTRRGGWWRQGTYCPYIEEVEGADGDLFVQMTGIPVVDDGTWLAPIPGPEACAALAEYGDAVMQRGPTQARGVSVSSALLALEDAIRAERNGAA